MSEEKEIIEVPGVPFKTLKKIVEIAEGCNTKDDETLSFVYIIGSCFPKVYENIKEALSNEYMRGFKEGFDNGRNFTSQHNL